MPEWQKILISTLAAGGLSAIIALISLVWRLSNKVGTVEARQTTMEASLGSMNSKLDGIASSQRETLDQLATFNNEGKDRVHRVQLEFERTVSGLKTACATNHAAVVSTHTFSDYQKEQTRHLEQTRDILGSIREEMQRRMGRPQSSKP